ncbi:helix-turn-helix domain-containing protein [Butyrivibrio sp. AE2032]|uniref:helix-turn-helix domain-containing protein n=1 Tax=Butyrivibrio sp. AE2032 TaxID=1458463 RepID=UPI000555E0B7|nr:helix-turn-helix domain-containing protein [Butyrivibrio sp. AE2032]
MALNEHTDPVKMERGIIDDFIKVRKKRHMSQAEIAKKANMHQAAIGRIENGSTSPRLDTMLRMLEAMGYTLAIVPCGKGPASEITLDINSTLDTLREDDLKRIKSYADELKEEERQRKRAAFERTVALSNPMDIGYDDKATLEAELRRKYGLTD